MSLAVNIEHVTAVLLMDGWHDVAEGSFGLDAYEFVWGEPGDGEGEGRIQHGGGNAGVCATGAAWKDRDVNAYGRWFACPLTAVLAVRYTEPPP